MIIKPKGNDIVGILHTLKAFNHQSVYDLVDVKGSSKCGNADNWNEAHVLVDYSRYKYEGMSNWCSEDIPNSNFTISFKKYQVKIIIENL